MNSLRDPKALAGNDQDGTIWCGLCAWTSKARTVELVEHRVQQHLAAAHGRRALSRFDHDLQKKVMLP
ncbi:MAG: hypothetical protein KGZ65_04170 [Sphingomonadales bacterium]|nr:hypothetical protein [Sphingomonadaceae bacterium]MBS3930409.1 hypothetical protein [Sphingomonadales bacterium]